MSKNHCTAMENDTYAVYVHTKTNFFN